MSESRRGERLFRAWASATPAYEGDAGRARFLQAFRSARKAREHGARVSLATALAMAAAVAACGWAILAFRAATTLRFTTSLGEGHAGAWLATGAANEMPLTFSEGTRVVMEPDSRGRVEQLGRAGATFLLERGRVRAHVVHRSSTSWRFCAGPFEVQVTGTTLSVEWDPAADRFAVQVDEGAVAVHGPNDGAVHVVRAGERYAMDLPSRTMRLSSNGASEADADAGSPEGPRDANDASDDSVRRAASASVASPVRSSVAAATSAASWLALEARGDDDAAYAAACSAGLASLLHSSSADDLQRLARVSRLSGHRDTEREALLTCRERFAGTATASVAAYELGRASSPGEASSWFETYLREQPNGSLAREATGRLLETRASAGDDAGAREAATRYLANYPDGPEVPLARRILAGGHR
jgi:TolA-binding protein